MRKIVPIVVLAVAALFGLTSCNEPGPGTVVDKDIQVRTTGKSSYNLYLLKTRESPGAVAAWGAVSARTYHRCYIGSHFPRCASVKR